MKEATGARESNAGDDFHFIWAAKKALQLLEPNTEFEALCVEGPSIEDSIIFKGEEKALLSIDVAEYFGGKKYEDASKVIFSQLKYSTRHGDLPWTLSSLSVATNSKKDNSIIQRLAQTYKGFLKKYPENIEKLKLKLVTNRSIEEKFKKLIDNCNIRIKKNDCKKYIELKNVLPKEYHEYLNSFYKETKLNTTEFIGFIECIDLSECGSDIRDIHESEVISSLARLGMLDLKTNYDKLIQFIRKQMSPEENESVPIDKNIMANFFNTIPEGLFPANSQVIKLQKYIKRNISDDIVRELIINRRQHICLHATGGIGKTTVVSDLESELPSGSLVLLYDCFGGGSYLDPSTPLHTYKNSIVQLSNQLALKCYTPFLVKSNLDESEYLRNFSVRLKQASDYIKEVNKEAVILLVLDAVDNSYSASEVFGDTCFADKLLKISLPENVSILVTSRTERLENFELPYGTKMIPLEGFNKEEQRNYIDMFYENASDSQCEEVRKLTNGNPRVQYYVFSKISDTIEEALKYLNPNGKNLKGIFREAIKKIDTRITSEVMSFEELCRALVELPRPIPIDIITSSTDYDIEKLKSACSEYLIGVYFGNGIITFRDEDFEYYLRTTIKNGESSIIKIAETLYNKRFDDYYSIKYVHIFLEKTQKLNEILDSIYNIDNINISLLEDEKNEIISKRIKSAFSIGDIYNNNYRLDAYKLLYLLTKCSATDAGVKEIILENIGLAKKLGFESTISRYISAKSDFNSLNELTLQTYVNSLLKYTKLADQFFATSCATIKQYSEEENSKKKFQHIIKTLDISRLGIYLAMRYDSEKLVNWMHGWSPYPTQEYFDITYSLLLQRDIEKAKSIISLSDDIDMFAACTIAFEELNHSINDEIWIIGENLTKHMEKKKKVRVTDLKYRIGLAELLLKRGKLQEAKNIAYNTEIRMDFSYISFYEMNGELPKEYIFRLYALRKYLKGEEYNFEDFWMPSAKGYESNSEREINEKRDELKKIIDFIIDSFFIRVRILSESDIDKPDMDEFLKEFSNCERGFYQFYNNHNSYDYCRIITKNIFGILLNQEKGVIEKYCKKFLGNKYLDNKFHFKVISGIIKNKKYIDIAAWYLNELDKKMNRYPQSAYELKEFYLECSKKAVIYDNKVSYQYFLKAIKAITGVDEEAYRRINLFRQLSNNYIKDENASELAYNFTRIIEDSYRRLDDRKHLPQPNIFRLLTDIHPSSAIAAACRLEDRDEGYATLGFEISIPYIIEELLYKDKISKEIAIALSNIDVNYGIAYDDIVDIVIKKLGGERKKRTEKIMQVIAYDIEKISGGFENRDIIEKISVWCRNNYSDSIEFIEKLNESYCFLENAVRGIDSGAHDNNNLSWNEVDKSKIECNKESLITTMKSIYYKESVKLAEYVLEKSTFENQLSIVELLIDIMYTASTNWGYDECFEIFIDYLNKWSEYNPSIIEWRKDEEKLDDVLDLYSKKTESFKEKNLVQISRIFLIYKDIILSKVIKRATNYLSCEPWEIFSYMESMASIENGENCSRMLEWCCREEIKNVHVNSSDREYKEDKNNMFSTDESIAFYLIKMLGHVEKEKRWYAVHAVYNLYKLDQGQIIDLIVKYIFRDIPELYRDEQYFYFKDSAIVYLLVALRKIVEEDTLFLEKYFSVLEELTLTNRTINILQRELAREILTIINPLSKEMQTACDVISKQKVQVKRRYLHDKGNKKTNFRFDTMDIVPKVYYFLGQIFQKSEGEIMEDCDKLISSWGITNEMIQEWNKKYKTHEYQRKSYGLDTVVEDLSKYVQYNAMYYVADEYRKTLSVTDDEYPIYTFDTWIKSWLTKIPGRWSSDIKTLPPNKNIFLDIKKYVKDGKYVINDNVFDDAFWYIYQGEKYFILYSNTSIEYEHNRKHYSISVGIVDKKYVKRLLKQAQRENYWIEENFISHEDDNYEFIEDVTGESYEKESRFETFDPYTNGMNFNFLKPNEDMEHFFGLVEVLPVDYSITKDESYPIKTQYWSYSNNERVYNRLSEGEMLLIQKEAFIQYLSSKSNQVVVVQMDVRYSDGYKEYGERAEEAERRKIFILDSGLDNAIEEIEVKINNRY